MPKNNNFFMPAEWEPHEAIWLAWPYDPLTFPGKVPEVEETYVNIIAAIHMSEIVNLLVLDKKIEQSIAQRLQKRGVDLARVRFHRHRYADVWMRDYGPIFVTNRKTLAITHWQFNAWGNKYASLVSDTKIPALLNRQLQLPLFKPGIVLEGGSIDVNGCGSLLTTEQCLLNPNRNPSLSKTQIETVLSDYLGARHVIWLKEGIAGDDTDGHIDDIARFVDPTTVVCAIEENPSDENYALLQENRRILLAAADQDGRPLTIVDLPMPGKVTGSTDRLPASYTNFYIGNKTVLVPVFGHNNDAKALQIIQSLFPERLAVGINCRDLVLGLGTLHCISQQQPCL